MNQFFFLDIDASFGSTGPGMSLRRLIDRNGSQVLGLEAWKIGQEAISRLKQDDGVSQVSAGDLERYIAGAMPFLDGFVEDFIELHKMKRIKVVQGDEAKQPDEGSYDDWRRADWLWKMDTFLRLTEQAAQDFPSEVKPGGPGATPDHLVVALRYLESAVLASHDGNAEEVSQCILNASWFLSRLTNLELIADAESRKASERARAGHARSPKRAAKDFVRECWMAWELNPAQYGSTAEFSRAMLDKFPDTLETEVTIGRWVRAWRGQGQ